MSASSTLHAVRAATRAQHQQLEAGVGVERIFESVAAYRGFLERLHGFHAAMEPVLEPQLAPFAGLLPLPPRAALLAADITALGGDAAELPRCATLPEPTMPGEVAGVLYVIEGSALGGAVLARMARKRLGIEPTSGAAFFSGDADLGPRWRRVAAMVEEHPAAEVIAGAATTFRCMEAWLVGAADAEPVA